MDGYTSVSPEIQTDANPFAGAHFYVSPDIANLVDQSIALMDPESPEAQKMETVKQFPSAVWLDRIEAIHGGDANGGRRSLAGHFEEAHKQQVAHVVDGELPPMTAVIIVYNLPDRDCAAAASNGTLHSDMDGMEIYQTQYIDVIAETFAKYPNIRIVAMLEPDSYPNMLTNLGVPACAQVDEKKVYERGIQYAIAKFADMPNVYTYIDIAHSGWLGWDDNMNKAITGFTNLVKGATPEGNLNVVRGFASNTSNYTPLEEPFIDPTDDSVVSGSFYEYNRIVDENSYVDTLYSEFVDAGFPSSLGFIIDTARNGWGGAERPIADDGTADSRIDRREHRGNWCNVEGAGIGERPQANPDASRPYIDAYFWMKPPGESDGIADPDAVDANEEGKSFDHMCGPTNADAMEGAPHAGHWFHEQFLMLIRNAHPAIELTPVNPPMIADADMDGIADGVDQCADTPAGESVNAEGCSSSQVMVDMDQDGVADGSDLCPATPAGETVNAEGCSDAQLVMDADEDGVADGDDQCPETPADEEANAEGCSASQLVVDTDQDGVEDGADQCAETPAGEAVNDEGCSESQLVVDADEDGVEDGADQCTATPAGEMVNAEGCSASQSDADNDGVVDAADMCADTVAGAEVDADGCSDEQSFVDADEDGVEDGTDACADTVAGDDVNAEGCSASQLDSDNDGVNDAADVCADTVAGAQVNAEGCSAAQADADSDGVVDAADMCEATPAGEEANADGCSASQVDADTDGVVDAADQCPNTAAGADVDANGCSDEQLFVDADEDGVDDGADSCPNTPAGATANAAGCAESQLDSDSDGVSNDVDQCANTTGIADANGCSADQKDTDNDGVDDLADMCTETPAGEMVNAMGCADSETDADGDGYVGAVDACPGTAAGAMTDANGCAAAQLDSDADGVANDADMCPTTAAGSTVNAMGCAASEIDSDGDGVNDDADLFPMNPMESADTDGDAVGDNADMCPGTAAGATVNAAGCADAQLDADGDGVTGSADLCADTEAGSTVDADGCALAQLAGDAALGAELYETHSCSICHGDSGEGSDFGPSINSIDDFGALATRIDLDMPNETTCKGQCAADVAAYVLTLEPPLGNVEVGAALYADMSCSTCHGADRAGGFVGYEVTGATMRTKYPDFDQLVAVVKSMEAKGAATTDQEAKDISAFLLTD